MHNDDTMHNIKEVKVQNVNTYKEIMLYTIPLYIHQNFGYQNLVLWMRKKKGKIWLGYWSFQHLAEILYILTNKTWGKYGKMNGFKFIMVKILIL